MYVAALTWPASVPVPTITRQPICAPGGSVLAVAPVASGPPAVELGLDTVVSEQPVIPRITNDRKTPLPNNNANAHAVGFKRE
jgi:hypothetical protein